jgi:hypothetical protein
MPHDPEFVAKHAAPERRLGLVEAIGHGAIRAVGRRMDAR